MFVVGWHQTEFMIIGSRQQLVKISVESVTVCDTMIKPIISLRNLGLWFDQQTTMSDHIGRICSRAFYTLYNLRQIRKCFTDEACKTLVHALVTCQLDYWRNLQFSCLEWNFKCRSHINSFSVVESYNVSNVCSSKVRNWLNANCNSIQLMLWTSKRMDAIEGNQDKMNLNYLYWMMDGTPFRLD